MSDNGKQTVETQEIVIKAGFENFDKPAEWNKDYEWTPSVSIVYYRSADKNTELRARIKESSFWVWDAIGRKQSKGHTYLVVTKSGTTSGTAWTTITEVTAEIFADGGMKRIQKPADGAAPAASAPPPAAKPPASQASKSSSAPPSKASAPASTPSATTTAPSKDVAMAKAFFDQVTLPQSDAWWRLKDQLNIIGASANNLTDMAVRAAMFEASKFSSESVDEYRSDARKSIEYWLRVIDAEMTDFKYMKLRERFTHLVSASVTEDHVKHLMTMAWADLPRSHYDTLREYAVARCGEIKRGEIKAAATVLPEAPEAPALPVLQESQATENAQEGTVEDIPF